MKNFSNSPNIGNTLARKLEEIGIKNQDELRSIGSIGAFAQLALKDRNGVCLIVLYALEGSVQGIRWHDLNQERKAELRQYYRTHYL